MSVWLIKETVRFLEENLTKDMNVFEYGSGGSTLFFAERAREVISIEHNPIWWRKINALIESAHRTNVTLKLIEAERNPAYWGKNLPETESYISKRWGYRKLGFKNYVTSIDDYPNDYFDVILIDGRARPSCLAHAKSKVKMGGYLILDDAERFRYRHACESLAGPEWSRRNDWGLRPYRFYLSSTCVWKRLR